MISPTHRAAILRDVERAGQWTYRDTMLSVIVFWWVSAGYTRKEVETIVYKETRTDATTKP